MAEQIPFTYQDILNAVEKLKKYADEPPHKIILMAPNCDRHYVEGSTVEECFKKAVEAWEKWVNRDG